MAVVCRSDFDLQKYDSAVSRFVRISLSDDISVLLLFDINTSSV